MEGINERVYEKICNFVDNDLRVTSNELSQMAIQVSELIPNRGDDIAKMEKICTPNERIKNYVILAGLIAILEFLVSKTYINIVTSSYRETNIIARYRSPTLNGRQYCIYTNNLDIYPYKLTINEKDAKTLDITVSTYEYLLAIAAYEVRRRIQGLNIIHPFRIRFDGGDPYLLHQQGVFFKKREEYKSEARSNSFINKRTNDSEFDASFIELLFIIQIFKEKEINPTMIREILFLSQKDYLNGGLIFGFYISKYAKTNPKL